MSQDQDRKKGPRPGLDLIGAPCIAERRRHTRVLGTLSQGALLRAVSSSGAKSSVPAGKRGNPVHMGKGRGSGGYSQRQDNQDSNNKPFHVNPSSRLKSPKGSGAIPFIVVSCACHPLSPSSNTTKRRRRIHRKGGLLSEHPLREDGSVRACAAHPPWPAGPGARSPGGRMPPRRRALRPGPPSWRSRASAGLPARGRRSPAPCGRPPPVRL